MTNHILTKTYKNHIYEVDENIYRERGLNDPENKKPFMVLYRSEIHGRNRANSRNFATREEAESFINNLKRQIIKDGMK